MKATTFRTVVGTAQTPTPHVSIVSTIYDRTACLSTCLRSIQRSGYRDLEQIVVSDAPGPAVEAEITRQVQALADPRVQYLALDHRANDWGITPAAVGLRAATGTYVAFLSDDNAYLPTHLGPLVALLDAEPTLGFVYSSCLYDGRVQLAAAPPRGGKIDLGQPLFRRAVLQAQGVDDLPLHAHAWDWYLIERLMGAGVPWRHHPAATFLFRAAAYPQLVGVARERRGGPDAP